MAEVWTRISALYVTERPFGCRRSDRRGRPATHRTDSSARRVTLAMPVVWSDRHRRHEPGGEIWVGVRTPGTELPARAERIREALAEAGARFVEAEAQPDEALAEIHDPDLLAYLAGAWEELGGGGADRGPGRRPGRALPLPPPRPVAGVPPAMPAATAARAGRFAYDTMTLIGPGTWEAARAAVDAALTAADLVVAGERPPTRASGLRGTTPDAHRSEAPAT